ncbi:MAG: aldo/keto reductase [Firmicutes bacterium]|jgi:predicted aldo/keto reductase-like oxidoreductase|nr:aldo/keto reductase [Bacillota bacterium]
MEKRRLGRTGLKVSLIGMGGIPIQRVGREDAKAVVSAAIAAGINFFDSARGYTDSEEKFGLALGLQRDDIYVATKSMARGRDEMARDIDASLHNFKRDYVDLYQLHNVRTKEELKRVLAPDGALAALRAAQLEGKVRHVGITGHIMEVLVEAVQTGEFETIQFPFNAAELEGAERLLPLAEKHDLGVIVMKPLAGGALRPAHLALRFLLDFPVSTIIPGMDSVAQIEENTALAEKFVPLTDEERNELQTEIARLGNRFCRRCEYCQPCPQGIAIPTIFTFDGYWSRYGLKEWAAERYWALNVQADACVECGECERRCPYNLPVRDLLKEAVSHFGATRPQA